ncbi:extracellular solute-binding protein [Rathayibacter sp. YIM 133350]|uniref:ABC transporter substrate-binding protein n=1 Tax=Rathayibacter sp. YIM 133350 TaxID=3131992 RepID=UPI00307CC963
MASKLIAGIAVLAATTLLAGCSAGGSSGGDQNGKPEGEITVLTQRTDLVDNVFKDYKKAFEKKYPDVTVKFEAITNYEDDVTTRMNTNDYGDVLLIPNSVTKDQLPNFFEPLGKADTLKKTYRFIDEQTYDGDAYGIAITGNASGLVYNKKVWQAAGVTEDPKTPDEFIEDLKTIKSKTGAVPLYTNYKDGWPLSQWQGNQGTPTADSDAPNHYTEIDAPWTKGEDFYAIDSLLFDAVHDKLTEDDPLTTNWEESKDLLGSGKVATMLLGSWAIVQMQQAATDAGGSADDIGYMPFPQQVDGAFHSTISGDYKNAISIHSKHKAAARAWIDWFTDESGYATDQGGVSPRLDGPTPDTLKDFDANDVKYVELNPAPKGKESLLSDIYNGAEIDLWGNVYRQKLVDIARGAADGTKDSYFDELNKKWKDARASVAG